MCIRTLILYQKRCDVAKVTGTDSPEKSYAEYWTDGWTLTASARDDPK